MSESNADTVDLCLADRCYGAVCCSVCDDECNRIEKLRLDRHNALRMVGYLLVVLVIVMLLAGIS